MDCWVITIQHTKPNASAIEQACVQHLQQNQDEWRVMQTTTWKDIRGSADFLTSLALSETQIYLRFKQSDKVIPTNPCKRSTLTYWAGYCETSQQFIFFNWYGIHEQLIDELLSFGQRLNVVFADHAENTIRSTPLTETQAYEACALFQLNQLKTLERKQAMTRSLLFTVSTFRKRSRALMLTISLLTCLSLWHIAPTWLGSHHTQAQNIALRKITNNEPKNTLPNWSATNKFLSKFGKNNRANLKTIHLYWNTHGDVLTHVKINRPRKRLPKGCQLDHGNWIVCPVIESTAYQGKN